MHRPRSASRCCCSQCLPKERPGRAPATFTVSKPFHSAFTRCHAPGKLQATCDTALAEKPSLISQLALFNRPQYGTGITMKLLVSAAILLPLVAASQATSPQIAVSSEFDRVHPRVNYTSPRCAQRRYGITTDLLFEVGRLSVPSRHLRHTHASLHPPTADALLPAGHHRRSLSSDDSAEPVSTLPSIPLPICLDNGAAASLSAGLCYVGLIPDAACNAPLASAPAPKSQPPWPHPCRQ